MDVRNNDVIRKAAERFAENLEKYPIEEQIAITSISKNVLNGCSWEFVRSNPDLRKAVDLLKKNKYCDIKEVTYSHDKHITGYLTLMNLNRLVEILKKEGMGVFNDKDLEKAVIHRRDAIQSCALLMKKNYTGKIGIFCTNDTKTITVDGISFPAFAITLNELCDVCNNMGYGFMLGSKTRTPIEVKSHSDDVIKACTIAPSSNALFINIAPLNK